MSLTPSSPNNTGNTTAPQKASLFQQASELANKLRDGLSPQFPDVSVIGVGSAARGFAISAVPGLVTAGDLDYEIYGVSKEDLSDYLSNNKDPLFKNFTLGGNAYVLAFAELWSGVKVNISLPLQLSENPQRYNTDSVTPDPNLSFEDAARRRDFTIDAVGFDYNGKKAIDPYDGVRHYKERKLVLLNPTFGRDPVAIMRPIKMAAEQGFAIDQGLQERIYEATVSPSDLSRANYEHNRLLYEFATLLLSPATPPTTYLRLMHELKIGIVQFPGLRPVFNAIDEGASKELDAINAAWKDNKEITDDLPRRLAAPLAAMVRINLNRASGDQAELGPEIAIVARAFCESGVISQVSRQMQALLEPQN